MRSRISRSTAEALTTFKVIHLSAMLSCQFILLNSPPQHPFQLAALISPGIYDYKQEIINLIHGFIFIYNILYSKSVSSLSSKPWIVLLLYV